MGIYYPEGLFIGKIVNHVLGETKTGKPQLIITFIVIGKRDPANPDGPLITVYEQFDRTIYRVITNKTIDFVLQDLAQLGFQGDSFSELDCNSQVHQDFRGQECNVYCKHDNYNGRDNEKWSFAHGDIVKPLPATSVLKLDALFGKQLKARDKTVKVVVQQTTTTTPVAAQSVPQSNVNDDLQQDDIPF